MKNSSSSSTQRKCAFARKCARLVKEQRARFYIMRHCVIMLICWNESDQPPYLEVITLAHNAKAHNHLPIKAELNLEISFIPSPPSALGKQRSVHFTQGIFF
ncbi:hypothetical protein GmHk_15G044857 [Glycine max]|nr:hypothetical protein GmHk_15G044857 [Glycine max]